jgi:hypothetical protein
VRRHGDPLVADEVGANGRVEREADDAVAHREHQDRRCSVHRKTGGDLAGTRLKERLLVRIGDAFR